MSLILGEEHMVRALSSVKLAASLPWTQKALFVTNTLHRNTVSKMFSRAGYRGDLSVLSGFKDKPFKDPVALERVAAIALQPSAYDLIIVDHLHHGVPHSKGNTPTSLLSPLLEAGCSLIITSEIASTISYDNIPLYSRGLYDMASSIIRAQRVKRSVMWVNIKGDQVAQGLRVYKVGGYDLMG